MIYVVDNAVAIGVATLAGLLFGALYYGLVGRPVGARGGTMAVAVLAELWVCAILAGAVILAPRQGPPWTMALGSAFIIWIGFVLPTTLANTRMRALPWRQAAADAGHWLGIVLVQAAILNAIGVHAPAG